MAWNAWTDKSYYRRQPYDGARVEGAWRHAQSSGSVPAISGVYAKREGSGALTFGGNDALTLGYSQLRCYQATFGYRLEHFPEWPLRPGPALMEAVPGLLNIKNPACYLYPRENSCAPGEHFPAARRADAERFLGYEPFPFERSRVQKICDGITLAALLLVACLLAGRLLLAVRRMFAR
jgi:hypothetical protein